MPWLQGFAKGDEYEALDDLALAPELGKKILGEGFSDSEKLGRDEVMKYEAKKG